MSVPRAASGPGDAQGTGCLSRAVEQLITIFFDLSAIKNVKDPGKKHKCYLILSLPSNDCANT